MTEEIVRNLLHTWSESLLRCQIHSDDKRVNGALICPSCGKIHGRCFEAMYPFMEMARETGDDKWVKASEDLFSWSEHTVSLPNGGYINDIDSDWKGITVFALIAFLDTLEEYSDLMEESFLHVLKNRAKKAADWIYNEDSLLDKNTNYPVSAAYALYKAGVYFKEQKFIEKSEEYESIIYSVFTDEGFIFGEGKDRNLRSDKNLLAVDIGYNVEETLPSIAFLGELKKDSKLIHLAVDGFYAHLEFMLRDGSWDNSFGTRNFKWTYWGSRTSDGAAEALLLLKDYNPVFYTAAVKNLELMKHCTFSGLLAGGPDYFKAEQPICIHHTFTHAKVLAGILRRKLLQNISTSTLSTLPRYLIKGLRYHKDLYTFVYASDSYSATITGYDWPYMPGGHTSGGGISLLEFDCYGPVLASSVGRYFLKEKNNMQVPYGNINHECPDFRIELVENGIVYSSRYCDNAILEKKSDTEISVFGSLMSEEEKEPSIECMYSIQYQLKEKGIEISIKTDREAKLILPVIAYPNCIDIIDLKKVISRRNGCSINVTRFDNGVVSYQKGLSSSFNLVPGFMFEHLELETVDNKIFFEITC